MTFACRWHLSRPVPQLRRTVIFGEIVVIIPQRQLTVSPALTLYNIWLRPISKCILDKADVCGLLQ